MSLKPLHGADSLVPASRYSLPAARRVAGRWSVTSPVIWHPSQCIEGGRQNVGCGTFAWDRTWISVSSSARQNLTSLSSLQLSFSNAIPIHKYSLPGNFSYPEGKTQKMPTPHTAQNHPQLPPRVGSTGGTGLSKFFWTSCHFYVLSNQTVFLLSCNHAVVQRSTK